MSKIIDDTDGDFCLGQRIKIIDGPWNEFTGVITGIDQGKKKVVVKINFWGRDTPVELNLTQIEPLS
jgi:transcriptional antiterminator NusG